MQSAAFSGKKSWWGIKFSTIHCKFPSEAIFGAQRAQNYDFSLKNFDSAHEFLQNCKFQQHILHFWMTVCQIFRQFSVSQ